MDANEYLLHHMVWERRETDLATARRVALLASVPRPRRRTRLHAALGLALIRLGSALLAAPGRHPRSA